MTQSINGTFSGPYIGLNSMLIGDRSTREVYQLADTLSKLTPLRPSLNSAVESNGSVPMPIMIDLRSSRRSNTDPLNDWSFAHKNSSFDILNKSHRAFINDLSQEYSRPICAINLYAGALSPLDSMYVEDCIDVCKDFTEIAYGNRLMLRVLGGPAMSYGDKVQSAMSMREWLESAQRLKDRSGLELQICVEMHQGQWPSCVKESEELYNHLIGIGMHSEHIADQHSLPGRNLLRIIEDPTNRYIQKIRESQTYGLPLLSSRERSFIGAQCDYMHVKNVKLIPAKSMPMQGTFGSVSSSNATPDHSPTSFQKIGQHSFMFGKNSFQWSDDPRLGDLDMKTYIIDVLQARESARHDHANAVNARDGSPSLGFGFSTEHVPASKSYDEALRIAQTYVSLIQNSVTEFVAQEKIRTKAGELLRFA